MPTPELNKALAKCQGEIIPASKDSDNPFFKSKYADLSAILEAVRKPLQNNGLSITQTTKYENQIIILITTLRHESGEEVSGEYPVIPLKQDPQGFGSALTYARRYALQSILMVAAEDDDDGNAASQTKPPVKKPANTQPPPANTQPPPPNTQPKPKPIWNEATEARAIVLVKAIAVRAHGNPDFDSNGELDKLVSNIIANVDAQGPNVKAFVVSKFNDAIAELNLSI